MSSSVSAKDLVGAWLLQGWEIRSDRGTHFPFGESPRGVLTYTEDGYMQASLTSGDRPTMSSPNPRDASIPEQAAAFRSCFTYAGRYDVRGDVVVHHVEVALNQAMVGTAQVRRADLADDVLVLSAEEDGDEHGSPRQHRLTWRRATTWLSQ